MRISKHPEDDEPVIRIEGLVNSFGDFTVHEGLDLTVRRGEILGVVGFLVPATILGLGIGPAVAVHEGSTLLVVVNALRLLAYRDPTGRAG